MTNGCDERVRVGIILTVGFSGRSSISDILTSL